ncbi:helix-turn-helix domain-containing protein [Commensalibacter oyaizuii]|uniref:Helix-turn-helix transcriptional regulator n=1 Tax=Commensalibacter oyaizuii TaxID=3043873 RepID=A0ABT6Q3B2_9PROT|nr:helix-turn-helix transcriptional regulator [Commensalibacter sp. TBRC 16381]MDI2091592.1 helix-turn-helix transcriptional regulator [Commensalibacter sp. TBRC 16381]
MSNNAKSTDKNVKKMLDNIDKWLERKNLTQTYVSAQIGIEPPSLSRIISGVNNVNLTRLQQIANVLEITVIELLSDPDSVIQYHEALQTIQGMSKETYDGWINIGNIMKDKK